MHIDGRKSKPYSEKLYNQLLLLAMIIQSENELPSYIIRKRFNKSERTYRRYIRDMHQCGLIPAIRREVVSVMGNEYIYSLPFVEEDPEPHSLQNRRFYIDERRILLRSLNNYSGAHPNPQDRLYRCGSVLLRCYDNCYLDSDYCLEDDNKEEIDLTGIDMKDLVLYNGSFYRIPFTDYDDLYEGLSLRSRQRDFKLLRQVIREVLSLQDILG